MVLRSHSLALALVLLTAPVAAQEPGLAELEALVAKADAADPSTDPKQYHANHVAALELAQKLFPEGSPEIAARQLGVAQGLAANQKFAEAKELLDAAMPVIAAAQPQFRKALSEALNLKGYIANFTGDQQGAVDAMRSAMELQREIAAGKPDVELAKATANLAATLAEAGRIDEALNYNGEALAILPTLTPPPPDGALWYANRAAYLRLLGRDAEAIAIAYDGIAFSEKHLPAGHPIIANLYANLAMLQVRQGRPNAALPLAGKAIEMTESAGGPSQNSAAMRSIFASALMQAGRADEARVYIEEALPIIDAQLGVESNRAQKVRENLARALLASGRADEARDLQRTVIASNDARLPATHVERMESRMVLGTIELARGDAAAAVAALSEGVALRSAAMPASHPDLLAERALLILAKSRVEGAELAPIAGEARALFPMLEASVGLGAGDTLTVPLRSAFGYLAEVFAKAGDADAAFRAQQWSARTTVDDAAIAAAMVRAEGVSDITAAALAERRKLAADRASLLVSASAQLASAKGDTDLAGTNAKLAEIDATIATADERLMAAGAQVPRFETVGLADLAGRLGDRSLFVQASDVKGGWLVTAANASGHWQTFVDRDAADIAGMATRLRRSLDPATAASTPFDREAASALHAALFRGGAAAALEKADELLVSANGALGAVPFGVLVSDGRHLVERLAVVRLPGPPRARLRANAGKLTRRIVGVGDVAGVGLAANAGIAPGTAIAMRGGNAIDLAALPPLPGAADELADIARALGAADPVLLTGANATEAALRATPVARGSVLAFATHGLVSGEVEGLREPALLLATDGVDDGLLTAGEIARMDLPARWVLLSACNTAAGAGPDAPGLSGLAQAFILAGADKILATHWPVRDDMARMIAAGTMRAAAGGASAPQALRRAVLVARASKAPLASHPALWGAFELVE